MKQEEFERYQHETLESRAYHDLACLYVADIDPLEVHEYAVICTAYGTTWLESAGSS